MGGQFLVSLIKSTFTYYYYYYYYYKFKFFGEHNAPGVPNFM